MLYWLKICGILIATNNKQTISIDHDFPSVILFFVLTFDHSSLHFRFTFEFIGMDGIDLRQFQWSFCKSLSFNDVEYRIHLVLDLKRWNAKIRISS